jgi:hypothetical protein
MDKICYHTSNMLMLTLFSLIYIMIWEIKKQEWKRIGMEEKI